MTERFSLRPITPGEFDAFCAVPVEAFNDADRHPESNEHERIVFEFDRSLAAFDGDEIVGTTAAYSFQLTVPGGVVGAGGVTFVSVLPSHRRRGILSAMMRHQMPERLRCFRSSQRRCRCKRGWQRGSDLARVHFDDVFPHWPQQA